MPDLTTASIGCVVVTTATFFRPACTVASVKGRIGHIPRRKVNGIAVRCIVEQILFELGAADGVDLELTYLVGSGFIAGALCTISEITAIPWTYVVARIMSVLNGPVAIGVCKINLCPSVGSGHIVGVPFPWCVIFRLKHKGRIFQVAHGKPVALCL